jgi:hypothetical protein
LSDVLTGIIGKAILYVHDDGLEMCCHEGMYVAAKMILKGTLQKINKFPEDYKIVICGHSLRAGESSLLGMLLKQHFPNLKLEV